MIAIVQYNAGNIFSVQHALERLGYAHIVTDDPAQIREADKVIFPGVGEASSAMSYLRERNMDKLIISLRQPVLGICLGLQLLCRHSEEGQTECLSVFDTSVKKFPPLDMVPHIGWNSLSVSDSALLRGISPQDDVYFVHSYYAGICASTIAVCDYIVSFSAALHRDNFYATQFHPEKSASIGEKILLNFLQL